MIVTIDGPAGSGKSTAAKGLAKRLGFAYLDTGAMYRAVTLRALDGGVDLTAAEALTACAAAADLALRYEDGQLRVVLDGRDVSEVIRSVEVTDNSHYVASTPGVRRSSGRAGWCRHMWRPRSRKSPRWFPCPRWQTSRSSG